MESLGTHRMQMTCVTPQNLSDIKAVVHKQTPDQRRGGGGVGGGGGSCDCYKLLVQRCVLRQTCAQSECSARCK